MSTTSLVLVIALMLLLSAFFSGMEIAFLSKNRLKLEIDRKQSRMFDYIVNVFTSNPGQYITAILVGNNISLVVYSLFMSRLIQIVLQRLGLVALEGSLLVETVVSTLVIIFVAEFLPKSIFKSNPNFYFKLFAPVIYIFYLLLYPLASFTTMLSQGLLKLMGRKSLADTAAVGFDRHDLASLIEGGGGNDMPSDGENEIRLFQNALDFVDLRVRDSMTPRIDIEAVDLDNTSIEEVAERFAKTKYSRLFVWRGSIDNIVGYINSKSMFRSPTKIDEILMNVNFVPETMPLNLLLQSFIKHKSNIAVVIDEFGGTAGVISLEDVLEQIFGEIEDEHDEPEMIERKTGDGEYVFSCRQEVKYLNEHYDLSIEESDEYDTLAGYIIYNHGGIPAAGETLRLDRFEIKILRTISSRLELVRLKIISEK
ncbi:MAG: hemolysin family protein [Rikenellaceae bacterium]